MKMKSTLGVMPIAASGALLMGLSAAVQAAPPSFNFFQVDYILSGSADTGTFYVPGANKYDVDDGLGLKGSFEMGDLFFISGEMQDINYSNSNSLFQEDFALTDSSFVGGGIHFPLADIAELYAQVGLTRATIANFAANGYGFKAGARVNVGTAEFGAWYQKSQADFNFGQATVDYDPEATGLDVAFTFADNAPQLVFSYSQVTYELGASGAPSVDVDTDNFSIGMRKTF